MAHAIWLTPIKSHKTSTDCSLEDIGRMHLRTREYSIRPYWKRKESGRLWNEPPLCSSYHGHRGAIPNRARAHAEMIGRRRRLKMSLGLMCRHCPAASIYRVRFSWCVYRIILLSSTPPFLEMLDHVLLAPPHFLPTGNEPQTIVRKRHEVIFIAAHFTLIRSNLCSLAMTNELTRSQ